MRNQDSCYLSAHNLQAMKKTCVTFAVLFCLVTCMMAQTQERCGTMDQYQRQLQSPALGSGYRTAQQAAATWRDSHPGHRVAADSILTIPVVVHVLYKNASQNISQAQIESQIRILNEDYRRLNPDTLKTPPMFDSIAADIQVEFCLASLDPAGAPTDGITRTSTSGGQIFGYFTPIFEDAKYDSLGGHDAWPAHQYLNIWVCETFPGLLGYAQFPGGLLETDGVVISYQAFGDMGTVMAPSTLGRTTTHEVGHWMGLYHIWGDDTDCSGSDSIFDTPNADAASQSDCAVNRNSCSNEDPYWGSFDPNDMVQNYMDYSHDSCMNMFSEGQKARMHAFMFSDPARLALFTSPAGCNTLGTHVQGNEDMEISLYPSPTDGLVNVRHLENRDSHMLVQAVDVTGKVVYEYAATTSSYSMDLSCLPAGLYLIRFVGESGMATRRLVLE